MSVKKLTYLAMLLAVVTVLSYIESMLPPLPFLPPGVKPGLSNIVVMYCVFFFGPREGFALGILKSGFVTLIRAPIAGLMSLSGGLLSVAVLAILAWTFKDKMSYVALSICGAIAHNLGQLTAASLLMGTTLTLYYFPVLVISGIIFGTVTGITLNALLPVFHRIFKEKK
ncbi:hypothetical protein FACS1894217_03320 [Clostridia bacterium]|nr:hypothetical protein FACS1894217_03320 [Clostridia bacterium]